MTVSWMWGRKGEQSTSKVLNKVLQLHLPLRLDIGAVHVSVEEDDGKGQNEDGVGVPELSHHTRVADAVALAAKENIGHRNVKVELTLIYLRNPHTHMACYIVTLLPVT